MNANRRDVLVLGATAMIWNREAMAAGKSASGSLRVLRIYAGPDGSSLAEYVELKSKSKPLPVVSVTAASFVRNTENWHRSPSKMFTIATSGTAQVVLSDGSAHTIPAGDLTFFEDLTGKGHITRTLTVGAALLLEMPRDFDIHVWAGV